MFNQLQKLTKLKGALEKAREELRQKYAETTSPDGHVKVIVRLDRRIESIDIAEDFHRDASAQDVSRKIQDTINEAMEKAREEAEAFMQEEVGPLFPSIPGLNPKDIGFTS